MLDNLKWSLQALALPADEQVRLFPSFVWVGDELANEFNQYRERALEQHQFTPEQLSALGEVDAVLGRMTNENNMDFWELGSALSLYPEWQAVRECARRALQIFGWSLEIPPRDHEIYVGPPDK
jgi:hypothetical protein